MRAVSAAVVPPIANPRFALVGDSLTQYGDAALSLNGKTLTRDAAGVVTVSYTAHGIYGEPMLNIVNCSDTSYEAFARKTTIDANSFSYPTGVTGAAGSISGGALTQAVMQNRHTSVGYWTWLQSLFGGGARSLGNYGQGGDLASDMGQAVTLACATAAEFVVIAAGINDINSGGASGATVVSRITTHVNTVIAAGKKCVLLSVTPLGSAYATTGKNTATLDANTGLAALANGTTIFYANAHQDLVDTGATQFTDGRAWSWATSDGVHWGERASRLVAQRIYAAISSKVTVSNCLPTASGNMPTIPGYVAIKEYGNWNATGGGFNGTGSSGTVATKFQIFSSNARTTSVNTLVDRGSSALGYYQEQVITPGGANDIVTDYFLTNSGASLASLGLTTSDTVMFAVEYSMTGALAANLIGLNAIIQSNSSGAFGLASCGDSVALSASTYRSDSVTNSILLTGELALNASVTTLSGLLALRFGAAGSAMTLDVGRVVLFKKSP